MSEEQGGDREQDVDDAHHERVDGSTDVAGDGAPDDADEGRDECRCQTDLEIGLTGYHQAPEHVETLVVDPKRAGGTEIDLSSAAGAWSRYRPEEDRQLVGVVDKGAAEAEGEHEDEDDDADDGELVLDEDPPDDSQHAPRGSRLTTVEPTWLLGHSDIVP